MNYTVQPGDTLDAIIQEYWPGHTYQELATLNNIPNPNYIQAGQVITIPDASDTSSDTSTETGEAAEADTSSSGGLSTTMLIYITAAVIGAAALIYKPKRHDSRSGRLSKSGS